MLCVERLTTIIGPVVGVQFYTMVGDAFPELNDESRFTTAGLGRVDKLTDFCGEKISVTTFVVGSYEDWGRFKQKLKTPGHWDILCQI